PFGTLSSFSIDPATTQLYPLSLHDALPISDREALAAASGGLGVIERREREGLRLDDLADLEGLGRGRDADIEGAGAGLVDDLEADRKSTRLNSSHVKISYAVFCLKKKKKEK